MEESCGIHPTHLFRHRQGALHLTLKGQLHRRRGRRRRDVRRHGQGASGRGAGSQQVEHDLAELGIQRAEAMLYDCFFLE